MSTGWIKLHRQLLDWEWYDDINVMRLFLHCLLRVNHKPKKWRGIDIERGQFYTSLDTLVDETGLTAQQLRTCFSKLKSTGEITSSGMARGRMITVVSFELYQDDNKPDNSEATGLQQADNRVATTNKNVNNEKNVNKTTKEWIAPDNLNMKAWKEFVQHRKEINKSMTHLSKTKAANQICGLSFEQQQATIDKSISSKWAGLFPEKQIQVKQVVNKNSYRPMPKPGE
ncbi:MAG: hypothetical protein COB12_12035 [Flavobacterium sp.]|nr:MAG: hypothetical protein COB12_12035 [Flavobacterium sp.]